MTDEEWEQAKAKLRSAIMDYFAVTEPEVYIDDWVLIAHKDSISMTAENMSSVGMIVPTGQPFHRTCGLLALAPGMIHVKGDY